jgi:hypothetical protein
VIEIGIHDLLLADPTVAGLAAKRGYPLVLPENDDTFPAFTYQVITSTESYTNDGPLGLLRTRLQIDTWAKRYLPARQLAQAIYAVLNGYAGTLDDGTVVYEIERDDESAGLEPGSRLYRCQSDWIILHSS